MVRRENGREGGEGGNTMTQYADADMLLAMYTFENDNELKELNERGRVPLPEPPKEE